jgi:hypothetical protein
MAVPLTTGFELYFGNTKIPENAVIPFKVVFSPYSVNLNIPTPQYKYLKYRSLIVNMASNELFDLKYIDIRGQTSDSFVEVPLYKSGNYTLFVFITEDVNEAYVDIEPLIDKINNITQRPIPNFKQTFNRDEFGRLWGLRHFSVQAQSSLIFPELAGQHTNITQQIIPRIDNLDIADILDLCMPGSIFEHEVCNNIEFYQILAQNRLTDDPVYLRTATKTDIILDLLQGEKFAVRDEDTDQSEAFKAKFPKAMARLLRLGKITLMAFYWDLYSLNLSEPISEEDRARINLVLKIFGTNTQMEQDSLAERARIWRAILDKTTDAQFNEFYDVVKSTRDPKLRSLFHILLKYLPASERDSELRQFNSRNIPYVPQPGEEEL